MLDTESMPTDTLDIDQKVENKYIIPEDESKQKHLARTMNQKGYIDLQLSTSKLAFQLVSGKDSGSSLWIFSQCLGCT